MKTYLVGGSVRTLLLNRLADMQLETKDHDWVVIGSDDAEMAKKGFRRVGQSFPVYLHPSTKEEYALARTADGSFSPKVTLEEDLGRRDLTINAMAMSPSGQLIDPLGGREDIEAKKLRHLENAFEADPLRMLRVARFAAVLPEFDVAPETVQAISDNISRIDEVAPERIFLEIEKAMTAPAPQRFVQVLKQTGLLGKIMPEVEALYGVPQPENYHPEIDTGIHTELALALAAEIAPGNPLIAFASLTHDLGKGVTPKDKLPSHHGHEKAGVPLVDALCRRIAAPNKYRDFALLVCEYHLHMHRLEELRPITIVKLFDSLKAFKNPAQIERFALACETDSRGRASFQNKTYPQKQILKDYFEAARVVTSRDLLEKGHSPGPALGEALRQARAKAIRNHANNRHNGH